MESRPLKFFAEAASGSLVGIAPDVKVSRVCHRSNEVQPGDLFFALKGDRFDGHDFVIDALDRGAVAAVVSTGRADQFPDRPRLIVNDPREALGRIAAEYRAAFDLPMIEVAGSNGKTTTKDLIASILGGCFDSLRSPESFNNDVGVPLTLLDLESRHVAAVIEAGTNHPGELAPLLRMVRPRIGVLTQIGEEHLEFFGSIAGVLEEEGWLADLLPKEGRLVLPGDPPWSMTVQKRTLAKVIRVGSGTGNDWRILNSEADCEGITFSVHAPREDLSGDYRIHLLGQHQVLNATLAAAVAAEFGLNREEIRRGLAACRPPKWRMHRSEWNGVEIIEDCYNANLDSTVAALETLRARPCAGRRVMVLGPMAELGPHTNRAHVAVGKEAARLHIDRLLTIGEPAAISAEAASDAGLAGVVSVDSLETAAASLRSFLKPGDCVLIKGSRSARMERLGPLLRDPPPLRHAA